MRFLDQVQMAMDHNNSLLCVGLDPLLEKMPTYIQKLDQPILQFNRFIIDATFDLVCAYKVQVAYYHAIGAENQLAQTIEYIKNNYPDIPVILDAKRGDIGSTADQYAKEAFIRYKADAITVNPYIGIDTIKPFTCYEEKGIILLCRTSNPGAAAIQNLKIGKNFLYAIIAKKARHEWNHYNNLLLVVGATNPEEMKYIREITGDMTFLVPGLGSQGGDVKATTKNGLNSQNKGIIINSSRGIIYAGNNYENFSELARISAIHMRDQVNKYR